jgi:hypothetical protein
VERGGCECGGMDCAVGGAYNVSVVGFVYGLGDVRLWGVQEER